MITESLTLEQKVGRLFFIGIPSTELTAETQTLLEKIRPGGVCLFARNIHERSQTRQLLDGMCDVLGYVPLLSLDQEGGRVDRLRRIMPPMPAPSKLRDAADAHRLGSLIGETIRILGFNMDFAPVVDVSDGDRLKLPNGLQNRTFQGSPNNVHKLGDTFLHGLEQHQVLGCLKHFPGLGASRVDSHEHLPEVAIDEAALRTTDLVPFSQLLSAHPHVSAMIAHASYPQTGLQETAANGKILPSSLNSSFVSTILRDELGFEGVAITDDLEMGAIVNDFGIGEACELAIRAGEDMLAICASPDAINEGFDAIVSAVSDGRVSESRIDQSVERIEKLRMSADERIEFDNSRLDALSAEIENFKEELEKL